MSAFTRFSTTTIGRNKNMPRVWLEGLYLLKAGFHPATRIQIRFSERRVEITLAPQGPRVVSSKTRHNQNIPVLDLNTSALSETFGPVSVLQVVITDAKIVLTPTHTQQLRETRCRNGKEGSIFSGGGLLTEAARQAGYQPAFAIEIDDRYAETYEQNHPHARMYNLSVEDVPTDSLPPVELITMGIPCQPWSRGRTRDVITGAKRDRNLPPEAHPLSDMSVWACIVIHKLNPATVVIEEAPGYLASAAGHMMLYFLKRAGYTVEARVIDPREHGELAARTRTVIVAHSGSDFRWPELTQNTRTFKDVRDDETFHELDYFTAETKPWLVNHWQNQTAKGNGFTSTQLDDSSTSIPVINARYFSQQGTGAVVKHRTRDKCWRWLSLDEVKRLHGVPDDYQLPEAKTTAGEIIGQGVIITFFQKIISAARNVAGTLPEHGTINPNATSPSSAQLPQLDLCFT